jgi:DnaJ family protein A protein 2
MEKKISLLEALAGFTFNVKHLGGETIKVTTYPVDVVKPGELRTIAGKGMPFYKDPMAHGNLIIKFTVDFPKKGSLTA